MPIQFCEECNQYIDLDWNVEHFDEDGKCELTKELNN